MASRSRQVQNSTLLIVNPQDGERDLVISLSEARRADGRNDKTASTVSQSYETLWLGGADTNWDDGGHSRMRDTAEKTGYGCMVTTGEKDLGT